MTRYLVEHGIDVNYTTESTVGKSMDDGDRVALIKDTLTSGDTLRANLREIEEKGSRWVSGVIVSVDRMEKGQSLLSARREIEKAHNVKIHPIVTIDDIIRAVDNGIIGGQEYLDDIIMYREKYGGE